MENPLCAEGGGEGFDRIRYDGGPEETAELLRITDRCDGLPQSRGNRTEAEGAVMEALEIRFGSVPGGLREFIAVMDYPAKLRVLFRAAMVLLP